jgi:K+-transporting ATPase ATPase C chain
MWHQFRTSFILLASMTLLTGVLYAIVVTVVAQAIYPFEAGGSIVWHEGKPVGSTLIGQPFAKPEYFWGRLSATTPFPFNAAASSGSNAGPLNPVIVEQAEARIAALRQDDPSVKSVPVDLVTASASGLDPHISPAAAEVQVKRVAAARRMPIDKLRALVREHTEPRQFGVLGQPRVNVLALNLALDVALDSKRPDRDTDSP